VYDLLREFYSESDEVVVPKTKSLPYYSMPYDLTEVPPTPSNKEQDFEVGVAFEIILSILLIVLFFAYDG
jgi:hypothetical protein